MHRVNHRTIPPKQQMAEHNNLNKTTYTISKLNQSLKKHTKVILAQNEKNMNSKHLRRHSLCIVTCCSGLSEYRDSNSVVVLSLISNDTKIHMKLV